MTVADIISNALKFELKEIQRVDIIQEPVYSKPKKGQVNFVPEILKYKTIKQTVTLTAPEDVPDGTYCKMTGKAITQGYRVRDVAPDALNDFVGIFSGSDGYVSIEVAKMFMNDWHLGNIVAFEDGSYCSPMSSPESALLQNRTAWKDVPNIVNEHRGQLAVILYTTDMNKRFWHRLKAGRVGKHTPVLMHESGQNISNNFYLDWDRVVEILPIIHEIRLDGFKSAKGGIAYPFMDNLITSPDTKKAGLDKAIKWEKILAPIRKEFYYEMFFCCLCEGYKL